MLERFSLTPGQLRIFRLLATGMTHAEAAEAMGISRSTLNNQCHMAYLAADVGSLVPMLNLLGWITVPPEFVDRGAHA